MDVFDLYAKLTLDTSDYDRSIDDATDQANMFASVLGANLATKGIGLAIDALRKLGEVAVDTFKQAISSYADYEQLIGGVETLFKNSADTVEKYANEAYKTAGLSANQYMETVTSFSASLLQSLGGDTERAAEMANMAIIDMADNANKMGTSLASIQNAYQGFARGNFTMLDNLHIGYQGTQQEMYRLMQDAAALDAKFAETAEFSIDSSNHLVAGYADIVEAIHIVQTEMGITGTTAKEGGDTISGSIATVKAAWKNLVANLGNDKADISKLIDDLFNAANAAWENIEPVAQRVFNGIIDMIIEGLPRFVDLGAQIIGAIIKGIALSPVKLVGKVLEDLGLIEGQESGITSSAPRYSMPVSSNATAYVPTVTTSSGNTLTSEAPWQTQEFLNKLTGGSVNITIQGDVYDDERSMRDKMRTAVNDVIDTEMAYG